MTETGKTDETAELPKGEGLLEGSPDRNKSADAPSPSQDSVKSDGESNPASPAAMPRTPTTSRLSLSDANVFKTPEPLTPTSSAKKRKRLTPEEKSLREKERQDKRRKLEEEKQKKEAERLEKARQKEAERLKKEEEKRRAEEEKRLEKQKKEEERLKKEEERKKIEEERKQEKQKKEEERKKKEDEKRQKDEEKRQKDEEKERERLKLEEKKAKQAQFFTNFFQKPKAPKVHTIENGSVKTTIIRPIKHTDGNSGADKSKKSFNPLPFQIKTDMAIAPLVRRAFPEKEKQALDAYLAESSTCADGQVDVSKTFFNSIKRGKGRKFGRTETILKETPEVEVLDEARAKPIGCFKWRMKLLQFEENRRPAYWGTWKRKAKRVTARRPFTKEIEVDYDFDSDDEWEDEPEDGEEIENSGDEGDDREDGEDEEDEEGWMVPHGYLSDSEREGDGGDFEILKCKEKEFYKSLKEKTHTGFPFIITENLSCYRMRLCPVFRSANVVKKPVRRKPRAPRKKKQTDEVIIKPNMPPPPPPGPLPSTPKPVAVKPGTIKPTPVAVKPTPVAVKTTPVAVKPAPVRIKPTPVAVKPAAVTVKPTAVAVKPSPSPKVLASPKASPVDKSAPKVENASTPSPKQEQSARKSERKRKAVDQKPNPYAKPPSGFLGMELPSDDEEDMDWDEEKESQSSESESESDVENESSSGDEDLFIPVPRKKEK